MSDSEFSPSTVELQSLMTKRWSPNLLWSVVACIVGGLIGCGLVRAIDPFFQFESLSELGISPPPELIAKYNAAQIAFWSSNYALNFGLIGLSLGLTVGLITTRINRILSGLAGGVGGLLGGALAGYVLGIFVAKALIASEDQSLVQSALLHFAIWASMFAPIILIVGFAQDGPVNAASYLTVGIVAPFVVSVVYTVASSMIFADANLIKLIPQSSLEQGVWVLVCSVGLGTGLYFGSQGNGQSHLAVGPTL